MTVMECEGCSSTRAAKGMQGLDGGGSLRRSMSRVASGCRVDSYRCGSLRLVLPPSSSPRTTSRGRWTGTRSAGKDPSSTPSRSGRSFMSSPACTASWSNGLNRGHQRHDFAHAYSARLSQCLYSSATGGPTRSTTYFNFDSLSKTNRVTPWVRYKSTCGTQPSGSLLASCVGSMRCSDSAGMQSRISSTTANDLTLQRCRGRRTNNREFPCLATNGFSGSTPA